MLDRGLMVVACDTQFGLQAVDRAWLQCICERVEYSLSQVVEDKSQ